MKTKKWLSYFVAICMLFVSCPVVCAGTETGGEEEDVTLAPYFFIEGADPGTDHLPLKGTEVVTDINGTIAETYVTQIYANEGEHPLNASYVFPASTKVSVHGMEMQIGDQRVTAMIREKEEAVQEYEEAKSEGKSASLLEEKRSNVFTMDVANIMPGDQIRIQLHYTELLGTTEGVSQFVFPTVVGPRYAGTVEEAQAEEGSWVESPYLEEGIAPDSTYNITVNLSAGVPLSGISCDTHEIQVEQTEDSKAKITLSNPEDFAGDRDFILDYRMTGDRVNSGLMLYEGEEENFFLLTIQPPERCEPKEILPREYIFVLDVSGSMSGFPMDTAKELIRTMVKNLRSTDSFNLFLFSDIVSEMSLESVAATEENTDCAMALIDMQEGGGGTELAAALECALDTPQQQGASRNVVVITDGYIYDEEEVFGLIGDNLNNTSFFSFGIGSSVNRSLMEGIAEAGMGEAFVVTEEEKAEETADRFRSYVEAPLLTDIQVSCEGFEVYDTELSAIPVLFAEKPVVLYGKWRGEPEGTIRVTGQTSGAEYVQEIDVSDSEPSEENGAIRYLWARKKVHTLTGYGYAREDETTRAAITDIGLTYSMVTPYTSFVAVLDTVRNETGESTDVEQPNPLPRGVSGLSIGGYLMGAEPQDAMVLLMTAAALAGAWKGRRKKKCRNS